MTEADSDIEKVMQDARDSLMQFYGESIRRFESAGRVGKLLLRVTDRKSFIVYDYISKNDPDFLHEIIGEEVGDT